MVLVKLARLWNLALLTFVWLPFEVMMLILGKFVSGTIHDSYTRNIGSVVSKERFAESDYEGSVYSLGYLKQWYRSRYIDINKTARLWQPAPNPEVYRIDGELVFKLLDLQKQGQPLVLNFGSCTLHPFVDKLFEFSQICEEFERDARFFIIYIEEAHASDGWKFKNNYDICVHKTLKDRLRAAEQIVNFKPRCSMFVDKMDDNANKAYAGLYQRLYILLDGVVVYAGDRGPMGYSLEEVRRWLEEHVKS